MFELPHGVRLTVDAGAVVMSRAAIDDGAIATGAGWGIPFDGEAGAWRVVVAPAVGAAVADRALVLPDGAVVRGRRAGDRLQPRGMRGHKKLQDYYVDRKVPRRERDAAPVIAWGSDVLWTPFGAAERASAGDPFYIEAEREPRSGAVA
jgi:tRNA(Ile)-lysidine synthetase-like protein